MSAPIPTTEPASIRAGDSASWLITEAGYPAGEGWGLTYTFINAAGKFSFSSAADGDAHRVHVLPAVTALWPAGNYTGQVVASDGTDSFTLRTIALEVVASFAATATLDGRSFAEKTLAALEAWIENHDPGVAEYEIAGRRMKYIPIGDLLKLRDQFKREVRGQSAKSGRVYLRF